MVGYRRIGAVEQHLANATSTTLLHQLRELWKSPRGTVLRIEALALMAIILSFLLAFFGSCRRWSNRWIVQKGFLAAHVLSLSLGTYSIGLMQSSSVKSEMYPVWAVSLLTLSGCMDQVTSYNGLDYKGPLSKMIFQLCLYCGYVLLMSFSTISGVFGNLAIGTLSVITFIKGFHRSLALVLPSRIRDQIGNLDSSESGCLAGNDGERLIVHLGTYRSDKNMGFLCGATNMAEIYLGFNTMLSELQLEVNNKTAIEDVCLGYSLSHLLQRRFLGLDNIREMEVKRREFESSVLQDNRAIDYKRTLKAIEIELAFLYDVFFTSNEFLHFYQAKGASIWAFASVIGICLVGVATAIPGTMASRHRITSSTGPPEAGTVVVETTTTADLVITLAILVSLALLQLVQLIRCWTSNWARVAFACKYSRERIYDWFHAQTKSWRRWMRLRAFVVTRMNWFDKYLWQDKLGQYSLLDSKDIRRGRHGCCSGLCSCGGLCYSWLRLVKMVGVQYIEQVVRELLWGRDINKPPIGLHDDVKTSVADFLGQIKSRRIGKEWWSLFVDNGLNTSFLPCSNAPLLLNPMENTATATMSEAYAFTYRVMVWHIATWYCEVAEKEGTEVAGGGDGQQEKNRRVAIALSMYCAYLVVSAPELLPGSSVQTNSAFVDAERQVRDVMWASEAQGHHNGRITMTLQEQTENFNDELVMRYYYYTFFTGVYWGRRLRGELPAPPHECTQRRCSSDDPWEVLALLWVQTLLYAAPYGNVQRHMQRLSQGGEFITHLWALLYHLGIDSWEHEEDANQQEEEETVVEREAVDTTMRTSSSQQAAGSIKGSSTTTRLRRTRSLPTYCRLPGLIIRLSAGLNFFLLNYNRLLVPPL